MIKIRAESTSQTLEHYTGGPVASAAYAIEDLRRQVGDAERTIASGAATVDTTATTTDAACGGSEADDTELPVAATTGFVVGRYYAIEEDGRREAFLLAGIESGVALYASAPLTGDYASGAAIRGLRITAAYPDGHADLADARSGIPRRVVWRYTYDGHAHSVQSPIVIVLDDAEVGADGVEIAALIRQAYPDLLQRGNTDGRTVDGMIAYARADVVNALELQGIDPERLQRTDAMRHLVMRRAVLLMAEQGIVAGGRESEEWARECRYRYSDKLAALAKGMGRGGDLDEHMTQAGQRTPRRSLVGGL